MGLPPLQWFDAEKGLAAVRALSALVSEDPKAVPKSSDVLSALHEVEQELVAASKHKASFHFCLLD